MEASNPTENSVLKILKIELVTPMARARSRILAPVTTDVLRGASVVVAEAGANSKVIYG